MKINKEFPEAVELEYVACPNGCNPDDLISFKGVDMLHGLPGEYSVVKCKTCFLERTNPRPTPSTIGYYYPDSYAPYRQNNSREIGESRQSLRSKIKNKLGLNPRSLPIAPPGKMLELGCSSGDYMLEMKKDGWDVVGIEFSPYAAKIARESSFIVHVGQIEKIEIVDKFDLIVAWMVFEHLHDPVSALNKMRSWLKPGGFFVFSIPVGDCITRELFKDKAYDMHLPCHLYHYTSDTIKSTLVRNGWEIQRIHWPSTCRTFLGSLEIFFKAKNYYYLLRSTQFLINNRGRIPTFIRIALSIIFGLTRQSGRIEVWATPTPTPTPDSI